MQLLDVESTTRKPRPAPHGGSADSLADVDQRWRDENLGRLMFAATRKFVQDKLRVVQDAGAPAVSEAMMALLLNLGREGTRLTDLALRAGQTKQSMIELVDKAEAIGLVERRVDPEDLRAKSVRFTDRGLDALGAVERGIVEAERRFARAAGGAFIGELGGRLSAYIGDQDDTARVTPSRRRNVGRLLALAARRFGGEVVSHVADPGRREAAGVSLALFRNLDLGGSRLTELAARAGVTKQSMRELVDRAERLGFVERRPDPRDRRAKIVAFTPAGLRLLAEMRRGVELAEARFALTVGANYTQVLKARLTDYLDAAPPS